MIAREFFAPQGYPYLEVSENALKNNLSLIRNLIPNKTKILIPVKANAYGCGVETIMPFLKKADIDMLGVANTSEAKLLRKLGWQKDILLLGGFFAEQSEDFFYEKITPSLTALWQIEKLQELAVSLNQVLDFHIKWDVGMGRVGFIPQQYQEIIQKLKTCSHLKITGMFCHFPCADEKENSTTLKQLDKFLEIAYLLIHDLNLKREEILLHSANSYSIFHFLQTHLDMVRPGIFFYGYFQNLYDKNKYQNQLPLKPALQLKATPVSLRKLFKGDTISYGSHYIVEQEQLSVGVFPLGYEDGVPRKLAGNISFQGHKLIGNVTMDQIMLEHIDSSKEIYIIGNGSPPLEYWAEVRQTITYEVLTSFGLRLKRVLV